MISGGMQVQPGLSSMAPPPRPMTPSSRASAVGDNMAPPPTAGYRAPQQLGGLKQGPQFRPPSSMMRNGPGGGMGLNTDVNVQDRPVTQQGMLGHRLGTAAGGPGRQVC